MDKTHPFTETDHWKLSKILKAREDSVLCYNDHEMILDFYSGYEML